MTTHKTTVIRIVEAVTGRDMRDIIHEAVKQHGTVKKAANAWGLSHPTLYAWIKDLGGEVETTRVSTTTATVAFPDDPETTS